MRRFDEHELTEALAHAAAGGQSVYLHSQAPTSDFAITARRQLRLGRRLGRLYDRDPFRLRRTLREKLHIYRWHPHGLGTAEQYHDLMGAALERALALCREEANA